MLELNKIYQMDCLEGLRQLDDNSVDLIITSPCYNNAGLKGVLKGADCPSITWKVRNIEYNGDANVDKKPEAEYQEWQLEILRECYRVLKPDGSMFYNHKNRVWKCKTYTPYEWLLKSPLIIRQEIVWDRRTTCAINPRRFMPTTERIFWLTKTRKPTFKRNIDSKHKTEVWSFMFETNNPHPAPYPLELPETILEHCTCGRTGLTILDPFMGSGTTALAAKKFGHNYIGFELFQEYIDMAENRLSHLEN